MNAVDTNVLFYSQDPRDERKQTVAADLIENLDDGVLLWQVCCEFIANARKLEPFGYSLDDAHEDIRELRIVWKIVPPLWEDLDRAQDLMNRYSLAFWDALLVACCLGGKVNRLYSEDLTGYDHIDGLELVNPFAP
jgi:predicted nucleic acid-binding protein